MKQDTSLRNIGPDDLPLIKAHLVRHMAESGDGDDVFVPYVKGSIDVPRGMDAAGILLPIATPGWQRWIGLYVEDGTRIVGHVDLKGDSLSTGQHRCLLGIGIERDYRGQGFGRRLMTAAIELCRDNKQLRWLDLNVFAHNTAACALYRKLGFVKIGLKTDRFRVGGMSIDDVMMTLDVGS